MNGNNGAGKQEQSRVTFELFGADWSPDEFEAVAVPGANVNAEPAVDNHREEDPTSSSTIHVYPSDIGRIVVSYAEDNVNIPNLPDAPWLEEPDNSTVLEQASLADTANDMDTVKVEMPSTVRVRAFDLEMEVPVRVNDTGNEQVAAATKQNVKVESKRLEPASEFVPNTSEAEESDLENDPLHPLLNELQQRGIELHSGVVRSNEQTAYFTDMLIIEMLLEHLQIVRPEQNTSSLDGLAELLAQEQHKLQQATEKIAQNLQAELAQRAAQKNRMLRLLPSRSGPTTAYIERYRQQIIQKAPPGIDLVSLTPQRILELKAESSRRALSVEAALVEQNGQSLRVRPVLRQEHFTGSKLNQRLLAAQPDGRAIVAVYPNAAYVVFFRSDNEDLPYDDMAITRLTHDQAERLQVTTQYLMQRALNKQK